jgi:hypothetical protein
MITIIINILDCKDKKRENYGGKMLDLCMYPTIIFLAEENWRGCRS